MHPLGEETEEERNKRLKFIQREKELIKTVFSSDQGRELLGLWNRTFNTRSSHVSGYSSEDTAFHEGTRMFYQTIQNIFDEETK